MENLSPAKVTIGFYFLSPADSSHMNTPYLTGYSEKIIAQIQRLIQKDKLGELLIKKYPIAHELRTDKALYAYTIDMKRP